MTISLTGVTVDTGVPAQNVRAQANLVISTAGNDAQALARQQLPSAVPAPTLLGAYSTGIAQQPKSPAKPFSALPSSSFAAQFIAQDAGSEEDLALFKLPPPPSQVGRVETPADDYLNDLRIARGEDASAKSTPTQSTQETQAREAVENAKPAATMISESTTRNNIAQFAASVPTLFGQFLRRQTLAQAKGISAYQLAEARNATTRKLVAADTAIAEPAN